MPRVLHLLSQRPSLTGSGITLDALVRQAGEAGWSQCAVVGVPVGDRHPEVGGLAGEAIVPLTFDGGVLDFPLPGMSDVMPYPSSRFSDLTAEQLGRYRSAWCTHLQSVLDSFCPDLVHAHHVWILSSMLKEIAPELPVVTHCHATGLRQMELCPHLAGEVRRGCARNDRFVVLHRGHAQALSDTLRIDSRRITVVGAGYRQDLFHLPSAEAIRHPGRRGTASSPRLLFVGKYSAAKGLPWLLDAFDRLRADHHDLELHVVGDGAGDEAERLRRRMAGMAPAVVRHGLLGQAALADLMRTCAICVLPSFFEGLPLVLVEAAACGCRIVATRLPGVEEQLAPAFGSQLELVPLPRLTAVDTPDARDLPRFVDQLETALRTALEPGGDTPRPPIEPVALEPFQWGAVFQRVETVWRDLLR